MGNGGGGGGGVVVVVVGFRDFGHQGGGDRRVFGRGAVVGGAGLDVGVEGFEEGFDGRGGFLHVVGVGGFGEDGEPFVVVGGAAERAGGARERRGEEFFGHQRVVVLRVHGPFRSDVVFDHE